MKLVKGEKHGCVKASLAMLFNRTIESLDHELFDDLDHPFPGEWQQYPKVPDMNVLCTWAYRQARTALIPFEYNPQCSPGRGCPEVPVWPSRTKRKHETPDAVWSLQLSWGPGLIEGTLTRGIGHMVAWDGNVVYDPRGMCYSLNVAKEKFEFIPQRFWLAKTLPVEE